MTGYSEFPQAYFTVVDRPFRLRWEETGRITVDWQDWLVKELRAHCYDVEIEDGFVRVSKRGDLLATLAFRSVAEFERNLAEYEQFRDEDERIQKRSPCPWVGEILGYVSYEGAPMRRDWAVDGVHRDLVGWVGHLCVGPVLDVYHLEVYQPIREEKYPLGHAMSDYGGFPDALISWDQAYIDMLAAQINGRLRALGISSQVGPSDAEYASRTSVTPFAFDDAGEPDGPVILDKAGKRIRHPERILDREQIGLWMYDLQFRFEISSVGLGPYID